MKFLPLASALLVTSFITLRAAVPTIVFVAGEFEYHSKETLPHYARQLETAYQVQTVVLQRPDDEKLQTIPNLEQLDHADLAVIMIRRMTLPEEQLNHFKNYLNAGKPLVGLRTASHSFENWREFDAQVLGGNYQNHYPNEFKTTVTLLPDAQQLPILAHVTPFISDGSLYKNTPLRTGTTPLLLGTIEGRAPEPIAWTHQYHGGRIFYTSLGHPDDFKQESFLALLHNAIEWGLTQPLNKRLAK